MSDPIFLSLEQVQVIHERQIARHGGTQGLRDLGGPEAAVFQPQNVYFYGQGDLYEMAAAYAYHIAEAQAFLDGNKRAAVGAALVFLDINGIRTHTATEVLYDAMIEIANRQLSRSELATIFRELFPA